jgi:glutathione S-transferase
MLEDNLYWIIVQERWMDDANFAKGPKNFFNGIPGVIRPLIVAAVRRTVRKNLHAHGIGRHTKDEQTALAARSIDSVANVLGENAYLMGATRCGADATVFAFIVGVLNPFFASPMRPYAERHGNLVAYCDRMRKEFYPA